jgi:dienelactone hydrolase
VVDDVAGAVAVLRAHGARQVAVVSLSTGKFDLSMLLGGSMPLDTYSAARRLAVPALFAVARGDPNVPVAQVQALYRMAAAEDKQLAILGGSSSGLHGWDLLGGANGAGFTPFAARVASFISAHTAAR